MPPEAKKTRKPWDAVYNACSTITAGCSIVCMSSMGATLTAAGAAANSGATGMAGMVSVGA